MLGRVRILNDELSRGAFGVVGEVARGNGGVNAAFTDRVGQGSVERGGLARDNLDMCRGRVCVAAL